MTELRRNDGVGQGSIGCAGGLSFPRLCRILSAMHPVLFRFTVAALVGVLGLAPAAGQSTPGGGVSTQVYRCGNEYLNDAALAQSSGCKPLTGGYVTVVPGTRVHRPEVRAPSRAAAPASGAAATPGATAQWPSRDNDARAILQDELKTAMDRLAEQQRLYNNGEPDKLGPETRNHQLYLDRINELRQGIHRYTSDIAGLQRELARLPAQ